MQDFSGKIAIVTGGGSGMGRELVRQLTAEGCNVAMCDVSARGMAQTRRLCEAAGLPQGLRITSHVADVSSEPDVLRFRDEAVAQHATDRVHLLFNNAGAAGFSGADMDVGAAPVRNGWVPRASVNTIVACKPQRYLRLLRSSQAPPPSRRGLAGNVRFG